MESTTQPVKTVVQTGPQTQKGWKRCLSFCLYQDFKHLCLAMHQFSSSTTSFFLSTTLQDGWQSNSTDWIALCHLTTPVARIWHNTQTEEIVRVQCPTCADEWIWLIDWFNCCFSRQLICVNTPPMCGKAKVFWQVLGYYIILYFMSHRKWIEVNLAVQWAALGGCKFFPKSLGQNGVSSLRTR